MEKLGCYIRVSSKTQEEDGMSIESQKRIGRKISEDLGLEYKEYNEGGKSSWSSEITTRPVLVELLNDVRKNKIKKIWVYNLDRLGRNSQSWYTILKELLGWRIEIYVNESKKPYDLNNPIDEFNVCVLSLVSQYDNQLRRMRTILGKKESLKRGNTWVGGTVSFGYKVKNKKLVIHPQESKVVKKMFQMYSEGKSTMDIKQYMDKTLHNPRRSNRGWNIGTIQMMLRKTIYKGKWTWEWKEKNPDGKNEIMETIMVETPKIVSVQLWNKVRKIVDEILERKGLKNTTNNTSLLKGLLQCEKCGIKLGHRFRNNQHYYGRCKEVNWKSLNKKDIKVCGMSKSLRIEETNKVIWENYTQILLNSYHIKEKYKQKGMTPKWVGDKERKKKLNTLMKYRSDNERTLSKSMDSLTDIEIEYRMGKMDKLYFDKITEKLNKQVTQLKKDIISYEDRIKTYKTLDSWVDWVDKMKKEIISKQDYSEEDKRSELLKLINTIKVSYNKKTKSHDLDLKFDIPIINDSFHYYDKDNKSQGYEIGVGKYHTQLSISNYTSKSNYQKQQVKIDLIHEVFTLRENKKLSFDEISKLLNKKKVKTMRGKQWNKSSVNRFYIYNKKNLYKFNNPKKSSGVT